jgi:ABC-type dipeptide/oligopeptide/nickel transport system permease component
MGLRTRLLVLGHALPNVPGPIITQIGLDVGYFLGGVVVAANLLAGVARA